MTDVFRQLRLDEASELTIAGQIRAQLTLLIADNKVEPGSQLPSVRALAAQLRVHVNTVRSAYAKLEADGVVITRHGVGTTVLPAGAGRLSPSLPRFMSNTVGVIIAGLDPFYLDLLRGIEATADEQGTLLFIVNAADSESRARAAIRQLTARGVQGIIAVSSGGAELDPRDGSMPPIVYVDQPQRSGLVLVFNFEKAARDSARHMLQHGHRRVGYITPPLEHPNVRELFDGHQRAINEAGIEFEPGLLVTVESFRMASGDKGLAAILEGPAPPAAVIVNGGEVTLGVLREAHRRGLRVPHDLAILGYGEISASQFTSPALTMVSLPVYEIGVAAMRTLQGVMSGASDGPRRRIFDGTLIVRESCGPHPSG